MCCGVGKSGSPTCRPTTSSWRSARSKISRMPELRMPATEGEVGFIAPFLPKYASPVPHEPVQTTVVGSYPFPGWLEFAGAHAAEFGPDDLAEAAEDAT